MGSKADPELMMKAPIVLFLLLSACMVLSGCTSTTISGQAAAPGDVRAIYQYHEDWSPGLGCYGRVTGYIYNARNTTAVDTLLYFNLVDGRNSVIRDSQILYLGSLEPGQSANFDNILDGDCFHDYHIDAGVRFQPGQT